MKAGLLLILIGGLFTAAPLRFSTPPPNSQQNAPETVTFKSGSLTLHGSIWKPKGKEPFPAVLYNHGSEKPVDYLTALGPVFTRRGYLLFIPERRGHGRSSDQAPWISDTLAEQRNTRGMDAYVMTMLRLLETEQLDDQLAALAYLKTRSDVDPKRIAVAGCTFGGIQTLLASERATDVRAGVNFAGAAITWERSPHIPERLRAAVRRAQFPIFFVQAENDYNTAPSRELSAEMQRAGKPHEMKIFPRFGITTQDGHTPFCANGSDVWGQDVFRFLDRYVASR